ncbi:hypothetical protein ABPG73_002822 [Tetrahymena malaccensis]
MKTLQIEKIRELMMNPNQIRNMSVIAHVDHGKTTLTDSLLARAGIISESNAGKACMMDTDPKEQEMGITIKSTGVSLYYQNTVTKQESIINLIDSPGHIDFSGEVTAALRVTDGALVVVDAVEGVAVQTETVLRQACQERIRPVLVINKLDRLFSELKDDYENIYQRLVKIIAKVNSILEMHENDSIRGYTLDPSLGNVAFSSGKQCWGFTLKTFARIYSQKFSAKEETLMTKLWGDNYFNPQTKSFTSEVAQINNQNKKVLRSFVEFVLAPLDQYYSTAARADIETLSKMVQKLNLSTILTSAELERLKQVDIQERIKRSMRAWLPLADAILEMVQDHLPSPKEAMKYRSLYLYDGPADDEACTAMRECNSEGPLMVYISKMVPTADLSRFYAFGRVFSGTISQGMKVRVQGPDYKPGSKEGLFIKTIQRTFLMMGKQHEPIESVPAGGTVLILGVDNALTKTGTLTTSETAHNIRNMKYTISPILRVAVNTPNQQDLPRLLEGLKMLQKYDPLVQVEVEENTGSYVVAGGGELHVQICLEKLNEFTHNSINIVASQPTVSYRETIGEKSSQVCLAKTANKLNRLYGTCEPLDEELGSAIVNNKINIQDINSQETINSLVSDYSWEREDAKRIWCFGPLEKESTNCIVNQTVGIQGMPAIQPSIITAFEWCTKEGLLCDEPLRNIRFNIMDAVIHVDPAHHRSNQITPAARRLFKACQYVSEPKILEPFYLCDIKIPDESKGPIYAVLNKRRGIVVGEEYEETLSVIQAHIPVSESFGLDQALKSATQGKAIPALSFSHWQAVQGNPLDPESKSGKIVNEIRTRKGLNAKIPELNNYLDKL